MFRTACVPLKSSTSTTHEERRRRRRRRSASPCLHRHPVPRLHFGPLRGRAAAAEKADPGRGMLPPSPRDGRFHRRRRFRTSGSRGTPHRLRCGQRVRPLRVHRLLRGPGGECSNLLTSAECSRLKASQRVAVRMTVTHRVFYWVETTSGLEFQRIEPEEVARHHGVPAKELFTYWQREIDCDEAVRTLPRTLFMILFFALMLFSHEMIGNTHSLEILGCRRTKND
eukprot:g6529.t1